MHTDTNLQFIREKICHLKSAIMYNGSHELIRMPNKIVQAMEVDESGDLWFSAKRPPAELAQYEREFPARLHFYRKGVMFYVEVSGKATIVDENYSDEHGNDILMKINLNAIEYVEPTIKGEPGIIEKHVTQAYRWLMNKLVVPHWSRSIFPKVQRS